MRGPKTARAAPAKADRDPRNVEQLCGPLNSRNSLWNALEQTKNLAATLAAIDPAALVAIGALFLGEARR